MKTGPAYSVDRMIVTPMSFDVPLDWNSSDEDSISVHAKLVVAAEKQKNDLPYLCRFQGGPGFEAGRPIERSGHLAALLERYRVILLDERGTGLSTPVDGPAVSGTDAKELAAYLRNFRADSIVRDAEHIRESLGIDEWSILGHSYGGFCVLTYLSFSDAKLSEAIVLAGFAPVAHTASEVYEELIDVVADRNQKYFTKFPEDVGRVARIVDVLRQGRQLVDGTQVAAEQFLSLGNLFGDKNGFAKVHDVVERAASDLDQLGQLSQHSLRRINDVLHIGTNPLYAVLHESIYTQGKATMWAAESVVRSRPEFALDAKPCPYFTGEMIFPSMFYSEPALRPLRDAAIELANYGQWTPLYDTEVLRTNTVPVVGTISHGDLYVARKFALETAELVGNCSYWITNEYGHQGHSDDPIRTMERLFAMLDEKIEPR